MRRKVKEIPYDQMDAAARPFVKILRDNGFETYSCCEGGEGHAQARGWIRIVLPVMQESFPIKKIAERMKPWMKESIELSKFVCIERHWPCHVALNINFYDDPKGRDKPKIVMPFLDLEFYAPLKQLGIFAAKRWRRNKVLGR